MSKLYTRTGDDGSTGLFGGGRVAKHHPRVAAYGDIDELNACIGFAACACDHGCELHSRVLAILREIQSRLFDIGADLATPFGSKHEDMIARLPTDAPAQVEAWIDEMEAGNKPMTAFILPGGSDLAARMHIVRTVCRRAERAMVELADAAEINRATIIYINRLSDFFFALARRVNADAGIADVTWQPRKPG
ncbi:MAG: cob(I)yrinic acid a,c-diamide adenosyltransferase [Phycisphaerales bacterium]